MSIDRADGGHHPEQDQLAEENARLRQQLAERDAKLARFNKAWAEQEAALAQLKKAVAERKAEQVSIREAIAERKKEQGTPRRRRHRLSMDAFLDVLPSSKVFYLLMLMWFLLEWIIPLFGERTQWMLVELAGITAGVITVGVCITNVARKRRRM